MERLERPEAALMSDATDRGDAGEATPPRRLRRLYRTPGTPAWASSPAVAKISSSLCGGGVEGA